MIKNEFKMTKNEIINDWKDTISDIINEVIEYDCEGSKDVEILVTERNDFNERINDLLWETIDGSQDVIYTYKAKEISEIINIYDIFEEWELTGERFESWSQCAFANIYDLIQNEISIDELITEHFADKYLSA